MNDMVADDDPVLTDAELALHLFTRSTSLFGGVVLRGDGPVVPGIIRLD